MSAPRSIDTCVAPTVTSATLPAVHWRFAMTSWIRGGALLLVAVVAMLPALTPSRHNTPALASAPVLAPLEGDEARFTDFKIDFSLPIAGALAALSLVGIDIDNSTFQAD